MLQLNKSLEIKNARGSFPGAVTNSLLRIRFQTTQPSSEKLSFLEMVTFVNDQPHQRLPFFFEQDFELGP